MNTLHWTAIGGGVVMLAIIVSIRADWISIDIPTNDTPQAQKNQKNPNQPPPQTATVTDIIDPITIELNTGHIVRYIGVRTPSVTKPVQCFGKEALAANESVIGKKVRLEQEPLLPRAQDGAWTRYVYMEKDETPTPEPTPEQQPQETPEETDEATQETTEKSVRDTHENIEDTANSLKEQIQGAVRGESTDTDDDQSNENNNLEQTNTPTPTPEETDTEQASPTPAGPNDNELFINERILEGGFGFPVVSKEMKYGERMLSSARYANATGKGLWAQCEINGEGNQIRTQTTDECVIKGKVTEEFEKIYRTPDCAGYAQTMVLQSKGGRWFCAEDIAEDAGFTKAKDCADDTDKDDQNEPPSSEQ